MYFKSDSWGKLGKDLDRYMKEDSIYHEVIGDVSSFKAITELMFKASGFEGLSRRDILKKVLEGIKMPVQNPKTGEQDYVDVSLVNKIVVDSEYVEDMISNNKIKFDISLSGNAETNKVTISLNSGELKTQGNKIIELQEFEEMLFKAINEVKDQRLEEVSDFKEIVSSLLETMIGQQKIQSRYLARVGRTYFLNEGVGIIRDIKANQDIGTFESLEYTFDKNRRIATVNGIILSGRTLDYLDERDRFEFAFYSLENNLAYSLMIGDKTNINIHATSIGIERFELLIGAFDEKHSNYSLVTVAQEKKSLLDGIDESHPLYDTNYEQFRQSRLDILEESKSKQKQEKLVNQFADIEMDF